MGWGFVGVFQPLLVPLPPPQPGQVLEHFGKSRGCKQIPELTEPALAWESLRHVGESGSMGFPQQGRDVQGCWLGTNWFITALFLPQS